jgi:hypothetical protein
VLGETVDNCTVTEEVSPKNDGRDWMVKVFGGAALATLPVMRVKRRYTKSTLAAARVVPVPGAKETT